MHAVSIFCHIPTVNTEMIFVKSSTKQSCNNNIAKQIVIIYKTQGSYIQAFLLCTIWYTFKMWKIYKSLSEI